MTPELQALYQRLRPHCCDISGLTPQQLDEHAMDIAMTVLEATPANPPSGRPGVASSAARPEPNTARRPVAPAPVSVRSDDERLATPGPSGTAALK